MLASCTVLHMMDDVPVREETNTTAFPDADSVLMLRVRDGDERAFTELVDKWKNPLVNFFYRSLGSLGPAEDLAQMTFIRIYRSASRYEPRAKFSTYLFHIARRLLINEYRHRQRKPMETVDPTELPAICDDDDSRDVGEIEEAFNIAVSKLPEKHATALLLLKQQELSYEEIANLMDASVGAIKTWIFRARTQLKEELKNLL